MKSKTEALFLDTNTLPDLYALINLDGRYVIYNRLTNVNGYDVSVYDTLLQKVINVTDELGTQFATGYDNEILVYIDGYACGKIYAYNLNDKTKTLVSNNGCGPAKISNKIVVWSNGVPNGSNIYGYNLQTNIAFDIATVNGFQISPDINGNNVIWVYNNGSTHEVHLKDIHTNKEKVLLSSTSYSMSWPSISDRYVIWGKDTLPNISGVEGIDLNSGETIMIQDQGSQQNGNMSPIINGNIAAWMAWRTGNGDIYGSILNDDTKSNIQIPRPPKPPKPPALDLVPPVPPKPPKPTKLKIEVPSVPVLPTRFSFSR